MPDASEQGQELLLVHLPDHIFGLIWDRLASSKDKAAAQALLLSCRALRLKASNQIKTAVVQRKNLDETALHKFPRLAHAQRLVVDFGWKDPFEVGRLVPPLPTSMCNSLRSLHLLGTAVTCDDFQDIAKIPQLGELVFREYTLKTNSPRPLTPLAQLAPTLKQLHFYRGPFHEYNANTVLPHFCELLVQLPNLQGLTVSIDKAELIPLVETAAASTPNLEVLMIDLGARLLPTAALAPLQRLRRLTTLHANAWLKQDGVQALMAMPSLQDVGFVAVSINDSGPRGTFDEAAPAPAWTTRCSWRKLTLYTGSNLFYRQYGGWAWMQLPLQGVEKICWQTWSCAHESHLEDLDLQLLADTASHQAAELPSQFDNDPDWEPIVYPAGDVQYAQHVATCLARIPALQRQLKRVDLAVYLPTGVDEQHVASILDAMHTAAPAAVIRLTLSTRLRQYEKLSADDNDEEEELEEEEEGHEIHDVESFLQALVPHMGRVTSVAFHCGSLEGQNSLLLPLVNAPQLIYVYTESSCSYRAQALALFCSAVQRPVRVFANYIDGHEYGFVSYDWEKHELCANHDLEMIEETVNAMHERGYIKGRLSVCEGVEGWREAWEQLVD